MLIKLLDLSMQYLRRDDEKSLRVRFVTVRGDECGAPGAKSAVGNEFHTADCEAFVETIVDQMRYLRSPIVIGGDSPHQVNLDLSQGVHSLSTIDMKGLTGRRPSSAIL